ncbi:Leucine aminopeptidase, partial [Datura stramonium]|nr:Leucine aminopeptidase [Datura stramonium]
DTPAARVKYAAKLNIPHQLSAVMAARHVERRPPLPSEGQGVCEDSVWCGDDRVVEEFLMEQPIPPYLFAFAVGELGFREVGPRTRVYSEAVPGVLAAAAREFAGTEEMIQVGERLFGPYDWEKFDLLVLPPSFPYGGMENPRMVFLTPTVIKGDSSGAQVVAHELAHSWTGNLITNKNNDHFWLNEYTECESNPLFIWAPIKGALDGSICEIAGAAEEIKTMKGGFPKALLVLMLRWEDSEEHLDITKNMFPRMIC